MIESSKTGISIIYSVERKKTNEKNVTIKQTYAKILVRPFFIQCVSLKFINFLALIASHPVQVRSGWDRLYKYI